MRRVQRLAAGAQSQFVGAPAAGLGPDVLAQPVEDHAQLACSDARVQVNFRESGLKWLALEYAKLDPA